MELLAEYGLFFAKAITVVISIVFILSAIAAQASKGKLSGQASGQIDITHINQQFDDYEEQLQEAMLEPAELKKIQQHKKKMAKQEAKENKKKDKESDIAQNKPRIFVIDFEGDVKASAVESLRREITAALTAASKEDEVLVNVESPGGMVHTYGLAASQLQRLRSAEIPLTICVDKVAASGGYLMACVANKVIAAPFAIVGSIGVLAQIPNFNRILKKHDVDYEVMTAGEHKAPMTMFGEITDKGKNKLKEELEETHTLFKRFINDHRPQVDIDAIATGEVWYGQQAIDNHLVDEISSSDDYLLSKRQSHDIYQIKYAEKKSIQEKLGINVQKGVSAAIDGVLQRHIQTTVTKDMS